MSNKLPWFTHDHNARNDEFIQKSIDKFGHFGYAAYFMLLEIIHEHGVSGVVHIAKGRLCQNLRSRWPQVRLYLDFCRTSAKVEFRLSGDEVELQNKKFIERQRKLKSNAPSMLHQCSVNAPIEEEREGERDNVVVTGAVDGVDKSSEYRMPWGEYRNVRVIDLPADYCEWLLKNKATIIGRDPKMKKALTLRVSHKSLEAAGMSRRARL